MNIGYYKVCITPPIGTPMSGYALREGPAIGVHDDLYVRVLYMCDSRGEEFAITVADVLGIDNDLYREIANEAKQKQDWKKHLKKRWNIRIYGIHSSDSY